MAIVTCGKVHTDKWVNHMAQELLDVPHLHLTLAIAKEMRYFFGPGRSLLQVLLTVAVAAVRSLLTASRLETRTGGMA